MEKLVHSSLHVIPISVEIAIAAGKIKKKDMSLADTLIAASALLLNATVISGDPHFQFFNVHQISYP
jgi:predicted nucleic acid-binding protein